MKAKTVSRHTTVTMEHDEHTFPIPFDGEFYQERVWIAPDSLKAVIGVLVVGDSPEDPFDGDEGEFYQFDPHYIHHTSRPEIDDFKRIIRQNPGRVFTHSGTGDNHGPGTSRCRVTGGPFTAADTRGENSPAEQVLDNANGYYIAPEDATDPAKYAASTLDSYTSYCNGEVYGVCIWTYERESIDEPWDNPDRDGECWGFIGGEYAKSELNEQFTAATQEATS